MFIALDIGNTNIELGLFKNDELIESFRIRTDERKTVDEYGIDLYNLVKIRIQNEDKIDIAIISSVVPSLDKVFADALLKYFNCSSIFIGPKHLKNIKILIDNENELGADLLVGAYMGLHLYPNNNIIVVDMGTAITYSYINSNKEFLGCVITPGIKTAYNSLIKATSKLQAVSYKVSDSIIGKNTINAIQSGAVYGTAFEIDGIVRRMKKDYGDALILITGGEVNIVKDYLEEKYFYHKDLVLEGLKLIYMENRRK